MLRNPLILLAVLVGLSFIAGCSDDVADTFGGGGDDLPDEMTNVALDSDLITEAIVSAELDAMSTLSPATSDEGGGSNVVTEEVNFSRTRSCPAGGEMSVEGTILRTFDPATAVMEAESSGNRSRTDCAFIRKDLTITVNGASEWEKSRRRVDGRPDGLQTSHYWGAWTAVRSDGTERFCEFDYTVVRDPDTHTRTIDGTLCGRRMRHGVGWGLQD